MSETAEVADKIFFTRNSVNDRLPVLGKRVLAQTRDGEFYVAARYENPANKNTYFWGIAYRNAKGKEGVIGKLPLDVINWYE